MYDFTVYLIHLNTPLCHARHYIGFTGDLESRFATHKSGHGAKMLKAANEKGISYEIVRTWKTGRWANAARHLERQLKRQKNSARLCPICKELRKKHE